MPMPLCNAVVTEYWDRPVKLLIVGLAHANNAYSRAQVPQILGWDLCRFV